MQLFKHHEAYSTEEACRLLAQYEGRAFLNAGGSDLLTLLKSDVLPEYPEALINIKTIDGLNYIKEDRETLRIGALTRLADLTASPLLDNKYAVLVEAAKTVATPQIRNMATVAGNLCQENRCWYFRAPIDLGGTIQCARKGNGPCLAVRGDNRYHSIIDGKKCFAVCPSDLAVALTALDARLVLVGVGGERELPIGDFYHALGTHLDQDEMVREIIIPAKTAAVRQCFLKFTLRKPIDFAVASVATVLSVEDGICRDVRIVLGAVAPYPVREESAEALLTDAVLTEETVEAAVEALLPRTKPLSKNTYKVGIAKALVKQALLRFTQ